MWHVTFVQAHHLVYCCPACCAAGLKGQPITFHGKVQLLAFCVFEMCVGIFWPSMMSMRAAYVPEELRATIINIFRIPLNAFVCLVLGNVSASCSGACVGACLAPRTEVITHNCILCLPCTSQHHSGKWDCFAVQCNAASTQHTMCLDVNLLLCDTTLSSTVLLAACCFCFCVVSG